jgi:hypothetical protein
MSQILESGDLYFIYRPRVGVDEVAELDDVQRFFVILEPDGGRRYRRVFVGRKRLPDLGSHEREWAFVAEVTDDPEELREKVVDEPGPRLAGAGRYAIVDHGGHTHLVFVLGETRDRRIEQVLNIRPQASYVVAVRNPDAPAPSGAGLPQHRRAQYPPELRDRFGARRFIPADPPALLDHRGAELVLIGAGESAGHDLGIELEAAPPRDRELLQMSMRRSRTSGKGSSVAPATPPSRSSTATASPGS